MALTTNQKIIKNYCIATKSKFLNDDDLVDYITSMNASDILALTEIQTYIKNTLPVLNQQLIDAASSTTNIQEQITLLNNPNI